MNNTDKNGVLADEPFGYRQTKDGRVRVFYHGREVSILAGAPAAALLRKLENTTTAQQQLALAKATGNFKRGNERAAEQKRGK